MGNLLASPLHSALHALQPAHHTMLPMQSSPESCTLHPHAVARHSRCRSKGSSDLPAGKIRDHICLHACHISPLPCRPARTQQTLHRELMPEAHTRGQDTGSGSYDSLHLAEKPLHVRAAHTFLQLQVNPVSCLKEIAMRIYLHQDGRCKVSASSP